MGEEERKATRRRDGSLPVPCGESRHENATGFLSRPDSVALNHENVRLSPRPAGERFHIFFSPSTESRFVRLGRARL